MTVVLNYTFYSTFFNEIAILYLVFRNYSYPKLANYVEFRNSSAPSRINLCEVNAIYATMAHSSPYKTITAHDTY